jgi:hypothetical protein
VGFLVNKVSLGHIYALLLAFFLSISFHQCSVLIFYSLPPTVYNLIIDTVLKLDTIKKDTKFAAEEVYKSLKVACIELHILARGSDTESNEHPWFSQLLEGAM